MAVNLAYELARQGGRIGLLDLDVYGPSLPVLVKPDDPAVRRSPLGKGMVFPIEHRGVKLLSLGYVSAQVRAPVDPERKQTFVTWCTPHRLCKTYHPMLCRVVSQVVVRMVGQLSYEAQWLEK